MIVRTAQAAAPERRRNEESRGAEPRTWGEAVPAGARPWLLWAGTLAALFVASILTSVAAAVTLRALGYLPRPLAPLHETLLREVVVRLTLLLFIVSVYLVTLSSEWRRRRLREQPWRRTIFVLFPLGAAFAMGDPFHAIDKEANWIRYWTAGPLVVGGVVALWSAARREHSVLDRLFGATFGPLMIAAGADEIFQFHERMAGRAVDVLPSSWPLDAQDTVTLALAVIGVVAVGVTLLLRRFGGFVGTILRETKYRLPLRLFMFAVLIFFFAMVLDSFEDHAQHSIESLRFGLTGEPRLEEDRFWAAVTDAAALASSIEELLEYLAALFFLTLIGTVFSIGPLGGASRPGSRRLRRSVTAMARRD